MNFLKKLIVILAFAPALAILPVLASEGGHALDHAPDRSKDMSSLQNGAKRLYRIDAAE